MRHKITRSRTVLALALFLILTLAACGGGAPVEEQTEPTGSSALLGDLTSLDDLRSLFNQEVGSVRLTLLLSPT